LSSRSDFRIAVCAGKFGSLRASKLSGKWRDLSPCRFRNVTIFELESLLCARFRARVLVRVGCSVLCRAIEMRRDGTS